MRCRGAGLLCRGRFCAHGEGDAGPGALPPEIQSLSVEPLALNKARRRKSPLPAHKTSPKRILIDHQLNFFPDPEKGYIALQGVHAMTEAGIYPLTLSGALRTGPFTFTQMVPVKEVGYPYDQPLTVNRPRSTHPSPGRKMRSGRL